MSQKLFAAFCVAALILCVAGWAVSDPEAYLVRDHSFFVSEAQANVTFHQTIVSTSPSTRVTRTAIPTA